MVYSDEKVKEKFGEKRIWVCVSNPFDEIKVARHVLEGLKVDHTKLTSLQALHQSVEASLSGHKFLLVLDDVWDENSLKWGILSECLKFGDPDSRVLVTTRKEEVARIMGTTPSNILRPQHISDSDCWFLISHIAFQGRSSTDNELEEIGKEIAKKCKGLPLAAKTLGGMLLSKDSVDEWKEILNSEIWELEQVAVELFPHIFLSYQELPPVLKRCFLILAIFPKDTQLEVARVVGIWMAHGFLNKGTKEDDMMKKGTKYLEFLVSRGLLEEKGTWISMHDIMHDFALHLSRDEIISNRVLDKIEVDSNSESTSKASSCLKSTMARHLYVEGYIEPSSIGFDVEKLRTCVIRNVAADVTPDLVKRLKMVRALYLTNCGSRQVLPSIEHLIHLRLLDLSDNQLVELPETIVALYNLQQLFLERSNISSLPNSMGKLINLILLRPDDRALEKFPESVGKLSNLQNLGSVRVGAGTNKSELLKDLNQLRVLKIQFESDYGDEVDAKKAAIGRKKYMTEFALNFRSYEVTDGVIDALQPPSNIQVLKILHLAESCELLPSWITSLDHLTELEVHGGGNVSTLPPLGKLRSLKKLGIFSFDSLEIIGREFIGLGSKPNKNCSYFPKLVELTFEDCGQLTGWEDLKPEDEDSVSVMPNLEKLGFKVCYRLNKLPLRILHRAPYLKTISINEEGSLFEFRAEHSSCTLSLVRSYQTRLEMIVEDSTKVPTSINYHSYITLLDIYFAELPISYLPPMGKLPYLQSLTIGYFEGLEHIGRDFLGIDDHNNNEEFVAFPHLLTLLIFCCGLIE